MGWSIGWDDNWQRDIGYGVPAYCDHPECDAKIDRGLSFVCGGEPYGGEEGCGLFFCANHLFLCSKGAGAFRVGPQLCSRCSNGEPPFEPKPEHPEWIEFKMTDPSWAAWRSSSQCPRR